MHMRHWRNRYLLFLDLILVPLAIYAGLLLRLEQFTVAPFSTGFFSFSALATVLTTLLIYQGRLYRQHWGYASLGELLRLGRAVTLALVLATLLQLLAASLQPLFALPRSLPFIALPLVLGAILSSRLLLRLFLRRARPTASLAHEHKVLIMGAGAAGALMVRELQGNPQLGKTIVGLLDDNPQLHGMAIHGVWVLGDRSAIPRLVETHHVQQVIIAMPRASGKAIRSIMSICADAGVETLTMPGLYELLDGKTQVSQIRHVEITDLLRRDPVETDLESVRQLITGEVVLVTGGGGSIGSELCRQIVRCHPAELIILGHGENSVFEIQQELQRLVSQQANGPKIRAVIADIRDGQRIHSLMWRYRPSLVFHAAAHKHVPLMELNPIEAVSNNILGTRNLLDAAMNMGVERFVMISSDKAVNPTSVMGATKRIAEMLVHQAAAMSKRPFVAVRFGNVLGSRGSVILTFKRQIAEGGPITITDPEMQRYFMTIPEAVQLVLQAAVLGKQGEVFLLDMGDPVKIVDLARDMLRLSGLEEGRDIDIVYTGLRPGEKLFEELFTKNERYCATSHKKVFIAERASSSEQEHLFDLITQLEQGVQLDNEPALLHTISELVPEYQPPQPLLAPHQPKIVPILASKRSG
ncbi:polysaccharide biosynthesis protein [Candidatus Viridilinea mediisalina]|uniref:Polysaccharide biosynthesis protein n=2 Tax=Candidatus Viridilinea mediisalina TaxID=2024553 RepID=A0A2A6RL57_9CHLR|nr:polysaccharide biosynthesis protein [Candidatus Viridilinea mediisalina]